MKLVRKLQLGLLILVILPSTVSAQSVIFQENFDQLPLRPPVDEDSGITKAFTHIPPVNWRIDSSGVPGVQNSSIGVTEWEGWSFANKDFWIEVSNDQFRSQFTRGQGTVAVADPDEWNDLGDPANNVGFFNAFLETPVFNIATVLSTGDRLQFQFDSSWRPQCCDDGDQFNPNGNNQTATIRARFLDGSTQELLRWESAPFFDSLGRPSTNPSGTPNPNFKNIALNELFFVDLSPLLISSRLGFSLEFGLTNAGDDFWWAMDNMEAISLTTVDGDMDLNGFLDEDDIDDFAQAMNSTKDYIATHFGEFPATRGSLDSVFDFDDIDWFVNLLNGGGIAASRATIIAAIDAQAVPEPSSACLAALLLGVALTRRRYSFWFFRNFSG
ncbi:MAG: hypothetical protein GXP24_06030 [Planctomycetes bacterium]|nr:hypothetical protein [Planctomycetota bacterium]